MDVGDTLKVMRTESGYEVDISKVDKSKKWIVGTVTELRIALEDFIPVEKVYRE